MDTESRIKKILKEKPNVIHTAADLAEQCHVSVRTIRTYIHKIQDEDPEYITISRKGYSFHRESKREKQVKNDRPSNAKAREEYIIKNLVFLSYPLSLNNLADYLCISETTLKKEISRINKDLESRDLYIKTKGGRIYLIGDVKQKKNYALSLIYNELDSNYFDLTAIQEHFSLVDLTMLKKVVASVLKNHSFFLDDYSLLNYVLHLALCIEFNQDQPVRVYSPLDKNMSFSAHVTDIIADIYTEIRNRFNISITPNQITDASLLMISRIQSTGLDDLTNYNLKENVGEETYALLMTIITRIKKLYGIDLEIDSFVIRFAFHLKNLLYRIKNNITINYDNFSSFKDDYPFLYVVALNIATIVYEQTGKQINSAEISFFVLHVGLMIQEQNAHNYKVGCGIVIFNYYSYSTMLIKKLKKSFESDLIFISVASSYEELNNKGNIDLIISNYKLSADIPIDSYQLLNTINEEDISALRKRIDEIKSRKTFNKKAKLIEQFLEKDLFLYNPSIQNHFDFIKQCCAILEQKKYVTPNYYNDILEHEKIASSAYRNVAIPHPLQYTSSIKSKIFIGIFKDGIRWGETVVNFVFMISLKNEDSLYFRDIMDLLVHICGTNDVLNCASYEAFLKSMIDHYEC